MEEDGGPGAAPSALDKNVAELTAMDVYDIAALVGHEFERVIDQHGCEAIARLMPKVVRVLEILEVLVSRHHVAPELDELRLELDRLRLERMDRIEKEREHRKVGSARAPLRAGAGPWRGARTWVPGAGTQGSRAPGWPAEGGREAPCPAPPGLRAALWVGPEFRSRLPRCQVGDLR